METETVSVPKKRRFSADRKLAVLQEWTSGLPLEEVCRRYSLEASQVMKWKKEVGRALEQKGELIPKSQVAAYLKRIDELEKALGRKAMEVDVLKKYFDLRGIRLPEGL